jgi:N-acetylglucosaminyl-diphospho-decaprenol L-rhamnosyltransferase
VPRAPLRFDELIMIRRAACKDEGKVNLPVAVDYSVVVLYFRRGRQVSSTLDDLLSQTVKATEIVLVDNGSGDGVIAEISSLYPQIRFVTLNENVGYAAGMNAGFAHLELRSDLTLFVTHELRMAVNCVEELTQARSPEGNVLLAGPALEVLGSPDVWSLGGEVTKSGGLRHIVEPDPGDKNVADVDWLDGSCILADTAAFLLVGGFPEKYFLYWEDVDLSTSMRTMGRVVNVRSAHASQSTNTTPVYYMTRNRILYWRERSARKWVLTLGLIIARTLLSDVLRRDSQRWARSNARLRGLRDGILNQLSGRSETVRERSSGAK